MSLKCNEKIDLSKTAKIIADYKSLLVIDADQTAQKLLGKARIKNKKLSLLNLTGISGRKLILEGIKKIQRRKKCVIDVLDIIGSRRKQLKASMEIRMLDSNSGKILEIKITPITTKKKSNTIEVENSELKFKALFESANDAILLMNKETFIDCNLKTLEMFDCKKDEIIDRPPYYFSPKNQPDGRKSKEKALEKIKAVMNGKSQFFKWTHKRINGTLFDAEVSLNKVELGNQVYIQAIVRDVTEQRKAERQLNESRKMLQLILDNIPQRIFWKDKNSHYLGCNKIFAKDAGLSDPGSIIGKSDYELAWRKEESDFFRKVDSEVMKSNKPAYHIIEPQRQADGRNAWLDTNKIPLHDIEANVVGVLGTYEDITARKSAEEALQKSEERFRLLVDNMLESTLIIDWNGTIKFANKSAANLVGIKSPSEGIGKKVFDFLHPDYIELVLQTLARAKINKETISDEYRIKTLHGDDIWVEGLGTEINFDNSESILVTLRDITGRKKAERQLNLLTNALHSAANGVVITDKDGKILWINTEFTNLTGYNENEVLGKNPEILKSGQMTNKFYQKLWDTILKGKVWRGELINKRKDGSFYNEEMTITPVHSDGTEVTHFIAVKQDITERKKAEQELKEAKENAEEMSRLKSNFLANMSHELRTPLVGILGFAEMLKNVSGEKDQSEMADKIFTSGQRLMETLNSVLDLSRIEANKLEIKFAMHNVAGLVKPQVELFRAVAERKKLYLKTKINHPEISILVDEHIFSQIINNLVNNALKYTSEGGVVVEVDNTFISNIEFAQISVIDTGIGIPKNNIDLIFQEFRQVSEGFNRHFEGTGLGLTITKRFIDLMNGNISVESQVGKGSRFTVIFPAAVETIYEVPSSQKINEEINPPVQSTKVEQSNGLPDVLLVENDDASKDVTRFFLKGVCNLSITNSGESAIELSRSKKFDAIIMDINLGSGISGIETVKRIRKLNEYKETPIVALTAFAMLGDKDEFLSAGCTHYISKPFSREKIIKVMKNALSIDKL